MLKKIQTDPTFKGVFGLPLTLTIYHNQKNPKDLQLKISKDTFMTVPIVILARNNFYLLNAMNKKIEDLKAGGLIDFWYFQNIDKGFLNMKDSKSPKVLRLDQLFGFFQILFCGSVVSFIVFVLELLITFTRTFYLVK